MADENTLLNSDLESRYEKYKGIIKNFTLMSDIFMRNVFKKRECLEYVLQVIMEKQDLHVIDQIIQIDYKNLQGSPFIILLDFHIKLFACGIPGNAVHYCGASLQIFIIFLDYLINHV